MRTEGQGNDGQGNETTRAGPLVGRCGLPGPAFLGPTFATPVTAPLRSQMPTACPWDCYVRGYVSEAIVPPPRRAAAEPPLPGGEKRKGRRPVVAANVRLPRASRGHPFVLEGRVPVATNVSHHYPETTNLPKIVLPPWHRSRNNCQMTGERHAASRR